MTPSGEPRMGWSTVTWLSRMVTHLPFSWPGGQQGSRRPHGSQTGSPDLPVAPGSHTPTRGLGLSSWFCEDLPGISPRYCPVTGQHAPLSWAGWGSFPPSSSDVFVKQNRMRVHVCVPYGLLCVCMCACVHMYMCVCTCVCMCTCVHVCGCVCMCARVHVCAHVWMCVSYVCCALPCV